MKDLELKLESLLTMYKTLRDTDEILTSEYFDAIGYDIDGYSEAIYEALESEDIDELRDIESNLENQVSTFSKLVIAMKNIKFIYG